MASSSPPASTEIEELAAFLAAEGVTLGASILDAPCGIGRRAYALAERGFRVTAVDANEVAVEALRHRVPEAFAGRLTYRSASKETMPGPPASELFEVVLCLDHAVGRDPPEEDVAFLTRLRGHLMRGGLLVADFLHRDFFASHPRPFAYHVLGDLEQHEFRHLDPVSGVLDLRWKIYQRDGEDLRFRGDSSARMRLLAPDEVRRLFERAGWSLEAFFGGWSKESISPDRRKVVVVARPAARG